LVVDALATYRITRLLISDGILDRPRSAVLTRFRAHQKFVEFVECPWCLGFWISASVVLARRVAPKPWNIAAETLAFSAVSGLVASRVRTLDDVHDAMVDSDGSSTTPTPAPVPS
jgi:hypothetical protein